MQPERPIEKLLRAFALKRREQAGEPLDLHPATRRMLQGEVSRQNPRPGTGRVGGWMVWARFWPRMAFASAVLAVLAVGAFLLFPPREESLTTLTLAKQEAIACPPAPESPPPAAPPPAATVAQPAVLRDLETRDAARLKERETATSASALALAADSAKSPTVLLGGGARDKDLAKRDATAAVGGQKTADLAYAQPAAAPEAAIMTAGEPASAKTFTAQNKPAAAPAPLAQADARQSYRSRAGSFVGETAASPRGAVGTASDTGSPAVAASSVVMVDALKERDTVAARRPGVPAALATAPAPELLVQNFTQADFKAARDVRKDAQSQVVLASFQLEQRGREIRIVDRDGSVYTGAVVTAGLPLSAARVDQRTVRLVSPEKAKAASRRDEVMVEVAVPADELQQTFPFSVRGTNATLKQVVVFAGNVQQQPAEGQLWWSNRAVGLAGRYQNQTILQNQLQNSRVTGRARLADGTELEINAVPTLP